MERIGELFETQGNSTLEWKIKEFSTLSNKKNARYNSEKFYFSGACWTMLIYPNGETERNSDGWIGLYLMRRSFGYPVTLNYTFCLETRYGNKEATVSYKRVFQKHNIGYGSARIISRSHLMSKKYYLIPQDILTVICTLKSNGTHCTSGSLFNRFQDVSNNLVDIYINDKRTDLLLNVYGGSIRAHRMILETRSPVFAAMFKHDTKENQTGEVSIEDVDKSTMEVVLQLLYSGQSERLTTEGVLPVFAAAEKYDIKVVQDMCMKYVTDNLSIEWFCDVIKFSELYQKEELSRLAKEYFQRNSTAILETDNWKTFARENSLVSVELLYSLLTYLLP